jgi:predicted ATP-grasp superfamily ATP-dependent carboligase
MLIERHRADVVIPVDVRAEKFLSRARVSIRNAHVFPVSDAETIDILDNKWCFAQFIEHHQIPGPTTRLITSAEDVESLDLDFPLVVKPLRLRFSRGLRTLASREALSEHVKSLAAASGSSGLPVIVQEYLPGEDLGCNILARDGRVLAWSAQVNPSRRSCRFSRDPECLDLARRIALACRFSGVANFDLRRDSRSGRIVVLECNPRFWLTIHASKVWGVDFVALGTAVARGEEINRSDWGTVDEGDPYVSPALLVRNTLGGRMPLRDLPGHLARVWRPLSDPLPSIMTRLLLGLFAAY